MVNRTIWREQAGKFQLGTTDQKGLEAALGPRFIGEAPAISLSMLNLPIPERGAGLVVSSPVDLVVGAIIGVVLSKLVGK